MDKFLGKVDEIIYHLSAGFLSLVFGITLTGTPYSEEPEFDDDES